MTSSSGPLGRALLLLALLPAVASGAKPPPPLTFTWSDAVMASGEIHAGPARFTGAEEGLLRCTSAPGHLSVRARLAASGGLEDLVFVTFPDQYRDQRACLTEVLSAIKLPTPYAPDGEVRFTVHLVASDVTDEKPSREEKARLAEEARLDKAALAQLVLALGTPTHQGVTSPSSQDRVLAELAEPLRACGVASQRAEESPRAGGSLVLKAGLDGVVEEVRFEGAGPEAVVDCLLVTGLTTLLSPGKGASTSTLPLALDLDTKVSGAATALAAGALPDGAPPASVSLTRAEHRARLAEEARARAEAEAAAQAEAERVAAEQAEKERLAAEQAAAEQAARDKAEAERKAAEEKAMAEKAAAERAAAEKAEKERLAAEAAAAEAKAAAERAAAEAEAAARAAAEKAAAAERAAAERARAEQAALEEAAMAQRAAERAAVDAAAATGAVVQTGETVTEVTLRVGTPVVSGPLDPGVVEATFAENTGFLEDCAKKQYQRGKLVAGVGSLSLRANADGSSSLTDYSGEILTEVGTCMEQRLRKLSWPAAEGESNISVPVTILAPDKVIH